MHERERKYRLIAEAQAFPLVGDQGFAGQVVSLTRDARLRLSGDSAELGKELGRRLQAVGRGVSLGSIESIRDGAWFPAGSETAGVSDREEGVRDVPLHRHLASVSQQYLLRRGSRWTLNPGPNGDGEVDADQILRWRWISLMLPVDLLLAARSAPESAPVMGDRVSIASTLLRRTLASGVADTHLHMGGAFSFSTLWAALVQQIAGEVPRLDPDDGVGGRLFGSQVASQRMLYAAAVVRLFLARFVASADPGAELGFEARLARDLRILGGALPGGSGDLEDCLALLLGHKREVPPLRLKVLYARLVELGGQPSNLWELRNRDPIAELFPCRDGVTLAETHFVWKALRYLFQREAGASQAGASRDLLFERCFWQYCRIRVRFFRYLTLEPGTAGLDWFVQAYGRIGRLRGPLEALQVDAAAELQGEDVDLRSLEVRTSPPQSRTELLSTIRRIARLGEGEADPARSMERCLTLHFIKGSRDSAGRLEGDPGDLLLPTRYGRWVRAQMRRARIAGSLLKRHPEVLLIWTGLDVAGSELAMPSWPTLFPIHHLRAESVQAAEQLSLRRPKWGVQPFRLTLHAGEDFRRLSEGIRRVHEAMAYGPLRAGDRIGHGIALFVDPAGWAERSQHVMQPRGDRLDDLLWEYDRYRRGDFAPEPGRVERLQAWVLSLGQQIYGSDALRGGIRPLLDARRLRHAPDVLADLGYPERLRPIAEPGELGAEHRERSGAEEDGELLANEGSPVNGGEQARRLLYQYLSDRESFVRGREAIDIQADESEIRMLERAQRWICTELTAREVTVESNPSSNQLISDMDGIHHHPLVSAPGEGYAGPSCSINSDDPLTFATRIANEYAYAYYALLRKGFSYAEALDQIDRIRQVGLRSRFSHPASADPDHRRVVWASVRPRPVNRPARAWAR